MGNTAIQLTHNIDKTKFMWLYAKYATGANPEHHCTNAIRGKYSKKFSKHNQLFVPNQTIIMDEFQDLEWDAIYICGVSSKGYNTHTNYPHNLHVAILPKSGAKDIWSFENWKMELKNGIFENVISKEELDDKYKHFDEEYVTCRMFRWAVSHYKDKLK